jgi:hypothetical protein
MNFFGNAKGETEWKSLITNAGELVLCNPCLQGGHSLSEVEGRLGRERERERRRGKDATK